MRHAGKTELQKERKDRKTDQGKEKEGVSTFTETDGSQ